MFYKLNPKTSQEILAEPICYNERLKHGKNTIKNKMLIDKGVFSVGQFIDERGHVLSYRDFLLRHDVNINFLTYHGWKQIIKQYITTSEITIRDNHSNNTNVCLTKLTSKAKGCKDIYNVLNKTDERPACCNKWEQKLHAEINWHTCFYNMKKISEVNMKWFQMRIVHRIIGTNVILKCMGITNNENCNYCNNIKDNIEHIFWDCPTSQFFWTEFINLVKDKCPNAQYMRLSKCLTLLGIDKDIKIDKTFYFILMLAKQYIYKCKLDSSQPHINVFRKKLQWRYKIEEYNSKLTNTYQKFRTDWVMYKALCA